MSEKNFEKKYQGLNSAQKQAVDRLDGPVMVIAGPGTGKTELLSVRVANILKKTDTLGENILCLTFTESGAAAMRERLANLMGKDAYRVGVYTFHGFGSEIINKYNDFFYSGAHFRPADELSTHQILTGIFESLPHTSPLASRMNGEFSYLKMVQNTISDFKKSGLVPDEIQRLVRHNQGFLEFAEPMLAEFFAAPMGKTMLDRLDGLYAQLAKYESLPTGVSATEPLSELFLAQLKNTINTAQTQQKVTCLTAWRNVWLEKNKKNRFVFKDMARSKKLLAASLIYSDYLNAMQEAALYDYDDMILRLVHALEVFPELRYNLQEQYQYIMVDEFQDTNGAQMRILLSLADNPATGGKPNILVVGDDDQAIYSFQGAELSNLLLFKKRFDPVIVSLRENYRSAPSILETARAVITQSASRLETVLEGIDKNPVPKVKNTGSHVELLEAPSQQNEYDTVAALVTQRIKNGQKPSEIAVLARNHADIQSLLPFFNHHGIDFNYEHQDDILQSPPIKALVLLARIIIWLKHGKLDKVNAHLPELLARPEWGCTPQNLWQLSLVAYENRKLWLEMMQQADSLVKDIAEFIIDTAYNLSKWSFEDTVDRLYGMSQPEDAKFISPLGEYFFPRTHAPDNPRELIKNIHSLNHLRHQLKDFQPDAPLGLADFVEYIDKIQAARLRLALHNDVEPDESAVSIMTAHKAKGREFESIFIINASDERWGSKSRSRPNRLSYPANLPIAPPGTSEDERVRLFFVAMTRAKRELVISYASRTDTGKPQLKADFLQVSPRQLPNKQTGVPSLDKQQEIAQTSWHNSITRPSVNLEAALRPILSNYRLSATHLNSFLNVARGGPRNFLVHNLLRFPISLPPQAALGSAIHGTLKAAHDHFSATKERKPIEDVLYDFEANLKSLRLTKKEFTYQLQKGSDMLQSYLTQTYETFSPSQVGERNFYHQNIVVGDAKVTGIIDVMDVDRASKTITIGDYKTGKPCHSWNGTSDYEKIKLHQYKQQLLFYKLLVESSSDFRGYRVHKGTLEFIEPDENGELVTLGVDYENEDLETFKKLIHAAWQRIMKADFIDTSAYPQNYKGILAFEKYLLEE